jgi:hypothetical protein
MNNFVFLFTEASYRITPWTQQTTNTLTTTSISHYFRVTAGMIVVDEKSFRHQFANGTLAILFN